MGAQATLKHRFEQSGDHKPFKIGGMTMRQIVTHFFPLVMFFLVILILPSISAKTGWGQLALVFTAVLAGVLLTLPWLRDLFKK